MKVKKYFPIKLIPNKYSESAYLHGLVPTIVFLLKQKEIKIDSLYFQSYNFDNNY